jgi:hypothetical protein
VKYDHGEILEGIFYAEELQKVIKTDDVYKIEPILKKRKMGQRVQYLVKWLGYPESFNSWIFKQDL